MANKVPVQGTVEAVNAERGSFKVDGKWYSRANQSSSNELPRQGSSVSFDAYGQQQNIWYRFSTLGGESNGTSGATAPAGASANGASHHVAGAATGGGSTRPTALLAAATLLQGSEGNVEQVGANAVALARAFEVYLSGARDDTEGMI